MPNRCHNKQQSLVQQLSTSHIHPEGRRHYVYAALTCPPFAYCKSNISFLAMERHFVCHNFYAMLREEINNSWLLMKPFRKDFLRVQHFRPHCNHIKMWLTVSSLYVGNISLFYKCIVPYFPSK